MRNRVAVMHGVNLDMLDRRPAEHYGGLTFARLEHLIEQHARALGLEPRFFHTNHEGEFVDWCHDALDWADGVIANPSAWTHYSWAIRDAVELFTVPFVEVHLSDVDAREEWRRFSVLEGLAAARFVGKGPEGYREALEFLVKGTA